MQNIIPRRQTASSIRIDDPARSRARVATRPQRSEARAPFVAPDPEESADLYFPRRGGGAGLGYRHFGTLADALEHARDGLTTAQRGHCVIQLGERRLDAGQVARLLEDAAGEDRA